MRSRPGATQNVVLVGLLGLAWGANWPAARLALVELPPFTFRAVGFSVSAALMFAGLLASGTSVAVPRRHWVRLAAVGALATVAYTLLSAFAQLAAPTSRAAVLSYTMPVWAVIFARIGLGEPFDRRRLVGLAFGVAGLAVLGLPLLEAGTLTRGVPLAIGSGLVWAAGSVVLKRWPVEGSPLVITAWQLALGALLTGIGALALDPMPPPWPVRTATWVGLAYNILIGQIVATSLWFTLLDRMPAGIASIGTLLVPGIGVVGATLILGERPTVADWIGLVLIVAASAAVLVRSGDEEPAAPNPPPPSTDPSRSRPMLPQAPNRPAPT